MNSDCKTDVYSEIKYIRKYTYEKETAIRKNKKRTELTQ